VFLFFFPSNRKKRSLTSNCNCLSFLKADQQEESQKARFASRAPIKVILDQNCVLLRLCFLHNLGVLLDEKGVKKGSIKKNYEKRLLK
jgi:hypothetical protein